MTIGSAKTVAFNASAVTTLSDGLTLNADLTVTGSGNTGLTGLVPTGEAGALGAITGGNNLTVAMAPAGMVSVTGSANWANTTINSGTLLVNSANLGIGSGTLNINGGTLRLSGSPSKAITVGANGGVLEVSSNAYPSGQISGGAAGLPDLVLRTMPSELGLSGDNSASGSNYVQGFTLAHAGGAGDVRFDTLNATGGAANTIVAPKGVFFAFAFSNAADLKTALDKFTVDPGGESVWITRDLPTTTDYNLSSGGASPINKDLRIYIQNFLPNSITVNDGGTYRIAHSGVAISKDLFVNNGGGLAENLDLALAAVPTDVHSSATSLLAGTVSITAAQSYTGTTSVNGVVKNALMGGGVSAPTLTISADLSAAGAVTIDRSATVNISGTGGKFSGTSGITVKGGSTLVLGDTTAANNNGVTNRVSTAGGLTLGGTSGGGTTTFRFADGGSTTSHSLSALTIAAGSSTLNSGGITAGTPGSNDLVFAGGANVARSAGGVAVITMPNASNLTGTAAATAITAASWAGSVVTITAAGHGYSVGQPIYIGGMTPAGYNGRYVVTGVSGNDFTYALAANPGAATVLGTSLGNTITGIADTSRITVGQNLVLTGAGFNPDQGSGSFGLVLAKTANTVTMSTAPSAAVAAAAITYPYDFSQFTGAPSGTSVVGAGSDAVLVGAILYQGDGRVSPVGAAAGYLQAPALAVKPITVNPTVYTLDAADAGKNVFVVDTTGGGGVSGNSTVSGSDLAINSFTHQFHGTVAFDNASRVLTVASGMILHGKNLGSLTFGSVGTPGELRTGNGQDLIFHGTSTNTTVYAKIGQEGGTTTRAVTKAGTGTLTLTNTNNQIGDIYVNGGTVTGSGGLNRLGDVDNTARTWYLFGGGIKTDSIASSANRTSIVVGPQGGYIVQTQSSPSGTLQIGTTTGPNATTIALNGTLYIGGNELGGDPSLYSTQLKGNISGPGIIFASGHSYWGRKHVVTLSGVNTAWSGGIYSGSTLPFSNINNTYSGNAVIRVDNTDALGTGPIVMDSGANGYNSMGMTFTANAGSSYANDFRLNMAMYFQNWKTNGPLTLSGRIVGSTGLLLQGYDAGGGSVSETVLAGTVSMNGTPNANGGAATSSVGAGQYYNYGTASVIQNFVNGQGGVSIGATALIGATTLVAGHINSMLSYNSLTTVESVGAEGYVRFSGTNSFIPGAVGPGYLAALRKGGSTVLNYGYLLTAGSTYTPPQGKSFVIGSLGAGTAQVGTLGAAGSGTVNFDGGTKHDVNTGQLLAGLYGGDVNIHGNASGDTASLNLLAKDADTVLVLGISNPVVFTPTWGDSGGQSCLTQMRTRTGGTTPMALS